MKKLMVLLVLLWMGFIFLNSSTSGMLSNKISYSIISNVSELRQRIMGESSPTGMSISLKELPEDPREVNLNVILRKNAHAFEYLILAVLISNFLFIFKIRGKRAVVYIMFICLLYAVGDEYHQAFVPGRTSLVSDVMIDFLGSLIGTLIYYLFYYGFYNKKNKYLFSK